MIKDKNSYRILVVEDNLGDYTIVEDFLTEQISDPVIVHADNFKRAFEILFAGEIIFDAILLDLTLPDKSGQNLINEMLRIASLCPIIILTGYGNIEFSLKSISHGISDYLLKDELNPAMLYKSIVYSVERKKIISKLKESEKRYSNLFHLCPQPMWVYDMDTLKILQANKAAIEDYGYSEEEYLNMTIWDIKPAEEIQRTQEYVSRQKLEKKGVYKVNSRHCKKTGEIIDVEISTTPIFINEKDCRLVVGIDVTEKKIFELQLTKAIIKAQEDERYEIGSELHDNVCQILATSLINLGMLKQSLAPSEMSWLDRCNDNITLAIDETRNLSHRLAPAFFNETSLEETFIKLLNTFNTGQKYKIVFHINDTVNSYPVNSDIQLNLYRVLQEQLRNIQKYANASFIKIEVLIRNNKLKMHVSDNGVGFVVENVNGGIGFANMKRRVELFYGRLKIESSPGNGCKIAIEIPL
jgi:PAS domain S-box-containing protein